MPETKPPYHVLEANTRSYKSALRQGDWFEAHAALIAGVLWNEEHTFDMTLQMLAGAVKGSPQGPLSEAWGKLLIETYAALNEPLGQKGLEVLFEAAMSCRRFEFAAMLVDNGLDLATAASAILNSRSEPTYKILLEERLTSFLHDRKNKQIMNELNQAKAEIIELRKTVSDLSAHVGFAVAKPARVKIDM